MTAPPLGIIADDLTGACDVAASTTAAGLTTDVLVGVPAPAQTSEAECVVIALASRNASASSAVALSVRAAERLVRDGAQQIYQKYCSTFDSTADGNIGPVADALRRMHGTDGMAVGTPATPAAGRTQYLGHLFVHDRLLADSPMRDHPLTPMRDSDLTHLLAAQSDGQVALIRLATLRQGVNATLTELERLGSEGVGHVLLDAMDDSDLEVAAGAVTRWRGPRPLIPGGGAGFAGALARAAATKTRRPAGASVPTDGPSIAAGPRVILSGSASARTREQVAAFDGPVVRLDPMRLARDPDAGVELVAQTDDAIDNSDGRAVLISATGSSESVREAQSTLGVSPAAAIVETAFAVLAAHVVRHRGCRRLIVAGGETAGAVIDAIGVRRLTPGALAATGVPWMTASVPTEYGQEPIALLLKSGNFGEVDLFDRAWETAP